MSVYKSPRRRSKTVQAIANSWVLALTAILALVAAEAAWADINIKDPGEFLIGAIVLAGAVTRALLSASTSSANRLPLTASLFAIVALLSLLGALLVGPQSHLKLLIPVVLMIGPLVQDAIAVFYHRRVSGGQIRRAARAYERALAGTDRAEVLRRGILPSELWAATVLPHGFDLPPHVAALYAWRDGQRPGTVPAWNNGHFFPSLVEALKAGAQQLTKYQTALQDSRENEHWLLLADGPQPVVLALRTHDDDADDVYYLDGLHRVSKGRRTTLRDYLRLQADLAKRPS